MEKIWRSAELSQKLTERICFCSFWEKCSRSQCTYFNIHFIFFIVDFPEIFNLRFRLVFIQESKLISIWDPEQLKTSKREPWKLWTWYCCFSFLKSWTTLSQNIFTFFFVELILSSHCFCDQPKKRLWNASFAVKTSVAKSNSSRKWTKPSLFVNNSPLLISKSLLDSARRTALTASFLVLQDVLIFRYKKLHLVSTSSRERYFR